MAEDQGVCLKPLSLSLSSSSNLKRRSYRWHHFHHGNIITLFFIHVFVLILPSSCTLLSHCFTLHHHHHHHQRPLSLCISHCDSCYHSFFIITIIIWPPSRDSQNFFLFCDTHRNPLRTAFRAHLLQLVRRQLASIDQSQQLIGCHLGQLAGCQRHSCCALLVVVMMVGV